MASAKARAAGAKSQQAAEVRAESDRMFSRGLKANAGPPATEDEVVAVSTRLNRRMCEMVEPPATASWFKLFRHMDADGSGTIGWGEFGAMVRGELAVAAEELPEQRLEAVWLHLDADGSGLITSGEFGAFMRKGEGATQSGGGTSGTGSPDGSA
jgi:hypothetical protein